VPHKQVTIAVFCVLTSQYTTGIDSIICFSSDYEKQEQVLNLAKQASGVTYACIGIHPDNIKRTNEKQIQQRLEQVHNLGMEKETYRR
jgi:Tat protein secretion system quality control protein TatD with DNase activity